MLQILKNISYNFKIMDTESKNIQSFTIRDVTGNDILYHSTSFYDLKHQIAIRFNTFTSCISLLNAEGDVLSYQDWNLYEKYVDIPNLYIIHDIILREAMKKWTKNDWKEKCKFYGKLHEYDIFNALDLHLCSQDIHEIQSHLFSHCSEEHPPPLSLLERLCERDPILLEKYGKNVFLKACTDGCSSFIRMLLHRGILQQSECGYEALCTAARWGHHDTLQLLIEHNVTLNGQNGGDALRQACAGGDKDIISYLIKEKVDITGEYGEDALISAARFGNVDILTMLIERGINISGSCGGEALVSAAEDKRTQVIELLLSHKVDISGQYGGQALSFAVTTGNLVCVEMLIEKGIDISGEYGGLALIHACGLGDKKCVLLFLQHGATDIWIERALAMASGNCRTEMVTLLLNHINENSTVRIGEAIRNAARNGHHTILDILLQYDIEPHYIEEAINCALSEDREAIVLHLIQKYKNLSDTFRCDLLSSYRTRDWNDIIVSLENYPKEDIQCSTHDEEDIDYNDTFRESSKSTTS